jgi:hypothetical protein
MKFILTIILLAVSLPGFSQIKKSISVGGDGTRGNFSAIGITTKAELKRDTGSYQWNLNTTYRWSKQSAYGKSEMTQYENEVYLTGNISKQIGKFKVIGFTEDERSYMRKIDLRSSAGLGLGVSIIKNKKFDIVFSEVILPEYFWSSIKVSNNNFTVRASSRLRANYESGLIKISSVTLFQPAIYSSREISFLDNLNMRSTNTIALKIKKNLEVGLVYTYSYQGYPHYITNAVNPSQETASVLLKYTF